MAADYLEQMKAFILLTEHYVQTGEDAEPLLEEAAVAQASGTSEVMAALRDLLFKLRTYQEDHDDNNYALGVGAGMVKASDMIENLIKRFSDEGDSIGQEIS